MSIDRPLSSGIIPPLVSPLLDRDTLDRDGLKKLLDHVINGGVHGVFLLGTTGEAPSLSSRLKRDLIAEAMKIVAGRIPVLVGVTDTSYVETVSLSEYSAEMGAAAVVLAPPYYFPAGQAELVEYLQHLAGDIPLPVALYNMPSHTKLVFEPETVRRAAEIPNFIGLKDSSGNMAYFHELKRRLSGRPDFSLFVGPEQLLAESLLLGSNGGVCGGANLFPKLYVSLYDAAIRRDLERVKILHNTVMIVCDEIYSAGGYWSSYLKGLKCSLSLKTICSDFMAEPFHRFREAERAKIAEALARVEIQLESVGCLD